MESLYKDSDNDYNIMLCIGMLKYCNEDFRDVYRNTIAIYFVKKGKIPPKYCIYDPDEKDHKNKTVREYLENNYLPVPNEWYDKQYKKNNEYKPDCVNNAIYGIITERDENIKPETQYESGWTVAMIYASQGITPPTQWEHDPTIQNKYGFTVQYYLQFNNIEVPNEWRTVSCGIENKNILNQLINYCQRYNINKDIIINNPSWQDNNDKLTFAIYLVQNKAIPPKEFEHCPTIQDENGFTVAVYLEIKGTQVPDQWKYDPEYRLKDNMTTAMIIANEDKIPSKCWYHDPNIKGGKDNQTVREYLYNNQLPIPNEWYDDQYKQNHDQKPQCVNNAFYGIITDKPENIKAEQQYESKWTVAIFYAKQGIIPPKCWEHNPSIKDKFGSTVAFYLSLNKIIPPKQWQTNPNITYKYKYNDTYVERTIAHILSSQGIIPPKEWQHYPLIRDNLGNTVEYYLLDNKKQVPKEWKVVNKKIKMSNEIQQQLNRYCKENHIDQQLIINYPNYQKYGWTDTFAMYLAQNKIIPPKEFKHDPTIQTFYGDTVAVYLEGNDIEVPKQWKYDKLYRLQNNMTTAMKIAEQGIIPSKHWQHNPRLQDTQGYTVAMYLSKNGIIPPKYWQHDPELQNNYNDTVAILLSSKGIVPTKQWIHDVDIKNKYGESIRSNLLKYDCYYINNKFNKLNKDIVQQYIQTEILNDTCQICLKEREQQFIVTQCNHKVCLKCFIKILNTTNKYQKCPLCKQSKLSQILKYIPFRQKQKQPNWFLTIDQNNTK